MVSISPCRSAPELGWLRPGHPTFYVVLTESSSLMSEILIRCAPPARAHRQNRSPPSPSPPITANIFLAITSSFLCARAH